jgi:hypothetical protein
MRLPETILTRAMCFTVSCGAHNALHNDASARLMRKGSGRRLRLICVRRFGRQCACPYHRLSGRFAQRRLPVSAVATTGY